MLKLGLVRELPSLLLLSGSASGGQESHLCQSNVSTGFPGILGVGGKQTSEEGTAEWEVRDTWASEVGRLVALWFRDISNMRSRKFLVTSKPGVSKVSLKCESSFLPPRPHSLMSPFPCFLGSPVGRFWGYCNLLLELFSFLT